MAPRVFSNDSVRAKLKADTDADIDEIANIRRCRTYVRIREGEGARRPGTE
ncbi:hypothetical protein ABZU45_13095 [Streptomyces avermitilis]|uniref:hypothetical protein n=1 Tax=Streptomyces avermitilis TaxID=33903 RepID=UPI0033B27DC6